MGENMEKKQIENMSKSNENRVIVGIIVATVFALIIIAVIKMMSIIYPKNAIIQTSVGEINVGLKTLDIATEELNTKLNEYVHIFTLSDGEEKEAGVPAEGVALPAGKSRQQQDAGCRPQVLSGDLRAAAGVPDRRRDDAVGQPDRARDHQRPSAPVRLRDLLAERRDGGHGRGQPGRDAVSASGDGPRP